MNTFERKVIEKVSSMPNIKWWHRNIERHEFCINGFINHYPDFIVMTNSGFVVMIETKGEHLTSNDDSREKPNSVRCGKRRQEVNSAIIWLAKTILQAILMLRLLINS